MKKFLLLLLLPLIPAIAAGVGVLCPAEESADVPVIMYHLITERSKYIGKYGITPDEIEKDLKYLKENGYTTVVMRDLVDFVNHGSPLPPKPIVLTFDDGNYSDFEYLYPLLKKYDMKAVLAIIGSATDKYTKQSAENPGARYPNLNWAQVKELHESGLFEIQSHGYDVHGSRGSGEKKGESTQAYHSRLHDDLKKLQDACEEHLNYTPNTFIYPLGIIGKDSRIVLEKLGMVASLSCYEGINIVRPGDHDCLFKMHRYNRPSGESIGSLLSRMDKLRKTTNAR